MNVARLIASCAGSSCAVAFFLAVTSTATLAADGRCLQLEALHRQYAGVQLTSSQKELKRKLVAWYFQNCPTRGRTPQQAWR